MLPGAAHLRASGNSSCWYTAHRSLGMRLISGNTLAFGLIGKTNRPHKIKKNLFWEYECGIWMQGRAVGIWGIHVSNSCNSVGA
jgi:hypothetical protein